MDTTPRKRSVALWFLRTYLGRIIIALVLIIFVQATSFWLIFVLPYQRERWVGDKLSSSGGFGYCFQYRGPTWIPESSERDWIRVFDRMTSVHVVHQSTPAPAWLHPELKTEIEMLEWLSEFGKLEHLDALDLHGTQVTDPALDHLKRLANLTTLDLTDTHTTPEGRALLRKALPNCEIKPNP